MADEDVPDRLPHVARHIERAEAGLRLWLRGRGGRRGRRGLRGLRRRRVPWGRSGRTFGIARRSARERFSGEERGPGAGGGRWRGRTTA
ncbi:hypothetical protein ACWGBV_36225, partial [Streptomyces sp. NPDC055051]